MGQNSVAGAGGMGGYKVRPIRFLLFIAGLGGLLYGIDMGIISGALPLLKDTGGLTANQLSFVVAAVLLGSVISTLFAGILSDWLGRKLMMTISGLLFVVSIPMIALSHGDYWYHWLVSGRLLQGISAGLIGVVVPLYLAECLAASNRGKGTAIFQWLLTLGIVAAQVIGFCVNLKVNQIKDFPDPSRLLAFKDVAWRSIFWVSLPPGVLFMLGSLMVAESPRWLFRRGRKDAARAALLRTRSPQQAEIELREMNATATAERANVSTAGRKIKESLLHRKYVVPFLLACIILACNQLTGINSILGYNAVILIQAGLNEMLANVGNVIFGLVNFLATIGAVVLVDRKGRKFLLTLGSAGIVVSLACVGVVFHNTEKLRVDCKDALQTQVTKDQDLTVAFNRQMADKLLAAAGEAGKALCGKPTTLTVIYSYGGFSATTPPVSSEDKGAKPLKMDRESCVPGSPLQAFFSNPLASLAAANKAPLQIKNALITPVPSAQNGWLTAVLICVFCAFFAVGPGVCVWLALSELMPTRIRSNGMSIALVLNQMVSTTIAAIFLPTVGKYGYATMFFAFAAFTVIYFVTAAFFLPETKGKTLEEIEEHFSGRTPAAAG